MKNFKCIVVGLSTAILAANLAIAQPCEPGWEPAIGASGINSGYVGAFEVYNDGRGDALYAGGSFPSMAGVTRTGYVARWERATNRWTALANGINAGSTNAFVTSMARFDSGNGVELVVGGFYSNASGVSGSKSLAKWNGTAWSALGSNFVANSADSVRSLLTWDGVEGNRLYVAGGFPVAGGVTCNGIAAYDGASWHALGAGVTGTFSPVVFKLAVFDDGSGAALYAAGRYDAIDGVTGPNLTRWNGVSWSAVGSGLIRFSAVADLSSMMVYDDGNGVALYVGGYDMGVAGAGRASVARWNGQNWARVGQDIGGRVTSMASFDDGNGPALYIGGTATPGINYFARLEGGQWAAVDGGVSGSLSSFPSVFALHTWDDAIFVGGDFTAVSDGTARGVVARRACGDCAGDIDANGVVDIQDLANLLANFGDTTNVVYWQGDTDGNGSVDLQDLANLLAQFGSPCPN